MIQINSKIHKIILSKIEIIYLQSYNLKMILKSQFIQNVRHLVLRLNEGLWILIVSMNMGDKKLDLQQIEFTLQSILFSIFCPKNLLFQFKKLSNLYFLIMLFFQMVPQITITNGQPTMVMSLSFVILVSMLKDIIEDYKR